jgi:cysteine desulfuration protein SufE
MNKSVERINILLSEFSKMKDWESRYQYIINLGKSLPPMSVELQTEENKIRGCQSQVWLSVSIVNNGLLHFEAESDALIVKGLISLLLRVYQDLSPTEIIQTPPQFLKDLGFEQHLSPSRANGLQAMVKQIQYYATAYQYLLKK